MGPGHRLGGLDTTPPPFSLVRIKVPVIVSHVEVLACTDLQGSNGTIVSLLCASCMTTFPSPGAPPTSIWRLDGCRS